MKKYTVQIEESDIVYIEIEANSEEEATDKAEEMYYNGQVDMSSGDCIVTYQIES